jgi:hypothetical protein
VVGHQSESVVDVNPAKEGFECTRETGDIPLHGVHPEAGAGRYFGNLVQSLHALFKRSQALLVLCRIRQL